MRTRRKPWSARELEINPRIVHDPETWRGQWNGYFGNDNPIRLEIGCGKGRFIAAMADTYPDVNFIALERDATILAAAARHGLKVTEYAHLAYIISDVEKLPDYFSPGEIQTLYIQFCDPWPNKKKWAKRRLTHTRFLELYRRLDIGAVFFKTDNRKLFAFSLEQFSGAGWILKNISLDLYAEGEPARDTRFMTEYEEKFAGQGAPIYRLEAYGKSMEGLSDERADHQGQEPCPANAVFPSKEQNHQSADAEKL